MEGRNVRSFAGNLKTFVIWLTVSTLYLPFCLSQDQCFLRNGKAKPVFDDFYEFSCNHGYKLEGPNIDVCSGNGQRCVRSFKDCPWHYCVDAVSSPLPTNCYCKDTQQPIQWKCVSNMWQPHCRCLPLSEKYYKSIKYYPSSPDYGYVSGTQAKYFCKYDDSHKVETAICNKTGGWSRMIGRDEDCACKKFPQWELRGIPNFQYKLPDSDIDQHEDGLVPLTTKAYYSCGYGYKVGSQPTCTPTGWSNHEEMGCVPEIPTTVPVFQAKLSSKTLEYSDVSTGTQIGSASGIPGGVYARACKKFSGWERRRILKINYKLAGHEIDRTEDRFVPYSTRAYYSCDVGYKVASRPPICTPSGWRPHEGIRCVLDIPTAPDIPITLPGTLQGSSAAHHHKEDERTLVIVSTSTGSILGALIILVIIVSCQRRLHYHRLRRARLRCRQDQEAFAAYITYHRNVGMTLPSYDEAVNQLQHGQPPTFDEAVANDGPQVDTSTSSETTNPVSITEGSATVVVRSSEDSDSSSTPITGSRLVRVFRFLFGGSAYTTVQGSYVGYGHLVNREAVENTNENEEVENGPSCPEEEERINEINAMNEVLSRAGLC